MQFLASFGHFTGDHGTTAMTAESWRGAMDAVDTRLGELAGGYRDQRPAYVCQPWPKTALPSQLQADSGNVFESKIPLVRTKELCKARCSRNATCLYFWVSAAQDTDTDAAAEDEHTQRRTDECIHILQRGEQSGAVSPASALFKMLATSTRYLILAGSSAPRDPGELCTRGAIEQSGDVNVAGNNNLPACTGECRNTSQCSDGLQCSTRGSPQLCPGALRYQNPSRTDAAFGNSGSTI